MVLFRIRIWPTHPTVFAAWIAGMLLNLAAGTAGWAQDPRSDGKPPLTGSAGEVLAKFEQTWNEAAWEQAFGAFPNGYIRPLPDPDAAMRMHALQALVRWGVEGQADLLQGLESPSAPVRMLAAQAIGFLGANVPTAELLERYSQETDPTVRLYLADSLGRGGAAEELLQALRATEPNGDVKKHLNYAIERRGITLADSTRQALIDFDWQASGGVNVGDRAPDFSLDSVGGQTFQLSQQRGKSAVVLVFIYGDT
jgi:hypothetical protein